MSKYDVGDVIVLLPEAYPIEEYWGQPLVIFQDLGDLYCCTDNVDGGVWIVALEEVKGFYKNEEV